MEKRWDEKRANGGIGEGFGEWRGRMAGETAFKMCIKSLKDNFIFEFKKYRGGNIATYQTNALLFSRGGLPPRHIFPRIKQH